MLRKIAEYLPSTVIPILLNFVLVFLYAGEMTAAEYGVYSIYLNSISLIYAAVLSFLQSAAFRFYSMKGVYSDLDEYYSTYVFMNIFLGIGVGIVLFAINLFFQFDWFVVSAAVLTNALYQFDLNMYRLKGSTGGYTFSRLSASFGALILILVCITLMEEITYSVPIYTFYGAYLLVVIPNLFQQAKHLSLKRVSVPLLKESARFGLPMMGVSVMGLLVSYSAQYVILFYLTEEAVGYYSLGFRLSDTIISNITMIILIVMTPLVMQAYDASPDDGARKATAMLEKLINLDLWVILPFCLLLTMFAAPIVSIVFPAYKGAEEVVAWIVLSSIFRSLSMITCKGLELTGATKKMFSYLMVSVAVNIGYMFVFIPVYGIVAAGHASMISYMIYNLLLVRESQVNVPIRFDSSYVLKTLGLTAVTGAICAVLMATWPAESLMCLVGEAFAVVIVYLVLSFAMRMHKGF